MLETEGKLKDVSYRGLKACSMNVVKAIQLKAAQASRGMSYPLLILSAGIVNKCIGYDRCV